MDDSNETMTSAFPAWVLREGSGGSAGPEGPMARLEELRLEDLPADDLPGGGILVEVYWSSLNYKDALALTGRGRIARRFPLVPGIDLAGVVRGSSSPDFRPGDEVFACGSEGIGASHWGGYARFARVPAASLIPASPSMGMRTAMAIGTAGYTAALAVDALRESGVAPDAKRPVLVTGAGGGLGGIAVMLLAGAGYQVAAVTGRPENSDYLRRLGAAEVITRAEMEEPTRPLGAERWAGAVDAVGGQMLARILAETCYGGSVASCGLAGGGELHTTVMPFILRAVRLLGIDAVHTPAGARTRAWGLLAGLPPEPLEEMTGEAGLRDLPALAERMLAGRVKGRVVIDVRR